MSISKTTKWTMARYEEESKAAVEVLESMYSGTFTVEMSEVDTSFEEDSDPDDPDELSSVKKQLDMDKISQPLNEQSEHLKEMFGGKIPECLLKQVLSHLNGTATPKKAKRARKLPSLEKLEKVCRPPNSFMVFAQEYRPRLSEENPQCKNKDISIMLGNLWRSLPLPVKKMYEDRAHNLAMEHKRKNPWYVYNPQEARVRKAQREQNKQAQRVARQRKNSGHVDQEETPPPHMMRHPCLPRNGPGMMPPFGANPHKVFHGSAAAAVSANEMRGLGGPTVQHAYGASPPPQRFYPAPYMDHNGYSMQYPNHHQLPAWFGQQPQYHPQQHHQMQPNGGYINRSLGREVPYMNSHYMPPHPAPHTPQQHQLLGPNNEQEEDLTPMPPHVMASQYEVEGTAPPGATPETPTQQTKETDEKKPSPVETENPDSQPLPPFQHAFGSTEIGRFAHEGFSAQADNEEETVLEIVEMEEGEFLVPDGDEQSFVIDCSIADSDDPDSDGKEKSTESVIVVQITNL